MAEKEIKQKKKGCFGKCIKWLFLIILGLLLILTVWNFICGLDEKKKLRQAAYGQTVDVNGKKMTAEIKGGEHDTTIILLPGLGSVSPVLEFRPLAEKLSAPVIAAFQAGIISREEAEEKLKPALTICGTGYPV